MKKDIDLNKLNWSILEENSDQTFIFNGEEKAETFRQQKIGLLWNTVNDFVVNPIVLN